MTFLGLVNRTRRECGISGSDLSTVVSATGQIKRLVDWVAQSWVDVQEEHQDWEFLRKSFSFDTVAGTQAYAVGDGLAIDLDDFGTWINDSFRVYLTSTGSTAERFLDHWRDYSEFRNHYQFGTLRTQQGQPTVISSAPDRGLLLGLVPDAVYTVLGEYYRSPQELTLDADSPIIPTQYHMIIVYRAMKKYGMFEVANEQISVAREESGRLMSRLQRQYLPSVQLGGSLI